MNIEQYLSAFERVYGKRSDAEREMIFFSLENFVVSRNDRANDLLSKESLGAVEIEQELFSCGLPMTMLCVDGRVLAKLVASLHGGAIRTPAADNAEFLPGVDGSTLFLSKGKLSEMLHKVFSERDTVTLVLDSHLYCAARKQASTEVRGSTPLDDGLFDDVTRKRRMAEAIRKFIKKAFDSRKRIVLVHTSFDPHSGYLFMGLEKEDVMNDERVLQEGFTENVLSSLVQEGKIISTEHWSREGGMLFEMFSKYIFDLDYEMAYRTSTLQFWKNIREVSVEALPLIEKELSRVFSVSHESSDVFRERAVFLLANAYTAFLLNHREKYPYGEHDESVAVVTSGDRGPYNRLRSFSIDPYNPNLSFVIRFVEGLIRNNRASGRASEIEREATQKFFGDDKESYVRSAVPVFFFRKLEQELSSDMRKKIEDANWSGIASLSWMDMTRDEFCGYLREIVVDISDDAAEKIEQLREDARMIFQPGLSATDDLLAGRLLAVFALRSSTHEIIALFPFLAKGYRERE
jgi:hypothetical protein